MNFKVAKMNWINFFNQMVGNPKIYDVKIERNEAAKKYPLLTIKKAGDVGYDLPSTKSITIKAATHEQIDKYMNFLRLADNYKQNMLKETDPISIEYMKECMQYNQQLAIEQLPRTVIPTGIKVEMLENMWCTICARSSSSAKMLITPDSIIDSGYRGELFAVVFNIGYTDVVINEGDRVCQLIFHERVLANMIEVDKLGASERGEDGFGSTGK